jgi:hypothetical protein
VQEYRSLQSKPAAQLTPDDVKRIDALQAQIREAEERLEAQRKEVEEQRLKVGPWGGGGGGGQRHRPQAAQSRGARQAVRGEAGCARTWAAMSAGSWVGQEGDRSRARSSKWRARLAMMFVIQLPKACCETAVCLNTTTRPPAAADADVAGRSCRGRRSQGQGAR